MISGTAVNSCCIVWMIAGWSGLHVQPHCWDRSPNHAKGVCNCRVARQPRSPHVPGLYEVGCECVSPGHGGGWLDGAVSVLRLMLLSELSCLPAV